MTSSIKKSKIKTIKIKRARLDSFVLFAVIFILGIITAAYLPYNYPKTFLVLGIAFYGFSHFLEKRKGMPMALLLAVFFISIFYGNTRIIPPIGFEEAGKLSNLTGLVTGQFVGEHRRSSSKQMSFNLENAVFHTYEEETQKSKAIVKIPGKLLCKAHFTDFVPEIGHSYSFFGTLKAEVDKPLQLLIGRVHEKLNTSLIKQLAVRIRVDIKNSILRSLPQKYAGLIIGFILGDSSHIMPNERELFMKTGLNHLLAVSGQHIMMLILMLSSFFYILRVPPVSRVIINSLLLSFYALITVGSPSVWRAIIMYLSAAISMHLETHYSPLKSVSLAAFLILLHNPNAIMDISFQLSFVAVLSIVILNEPILTIIRLFRLPEPVNNYLTISLAANIGIMPISAYIFGTIPLSSLIINPLVLWAFAFIIPMSFIIAVIVSFKASLILYIVPSLALIIESIIVVLKWGANIPGQYLYFEQMPGFTVILLYLLLFGLTVYHNKFLIWKTIRHYRNNLTKPTLITIEDHELTEDMEVYEEFLKNTDHKPSVHPPTRMYYPLKNTDFIETTDHLLLTCKRPSVKDLPKNLEGTFPLDRLRLENQNLFYTLATLQQGLLTREPHRIIQSQIFIMSLLGSEFLMRIPFHLTPAPNIAEMRPEHKAEDRNLQIVLLTDLVLNSSLLTRTKNHELMSLISTLQNLYSRSCNQFERIVDSGELEETLRLHFILRTDMLNWCKEFIKFDTEIKRKANKI